MSTIVTVSTAPQAGMEGKQTELTIDWAGMSEEGYRAFAQQALVIKLQAQWRKQGIPPKAQVRACEHLPGTRAKALTLEQVVAQAKDNPELRAKLLEMLR